MKDPDRLGGASEATDAAPSALEAVVSPVAQADEPRLLALLALLGTMTLFAFVVTARRRAGRS